MIKIKRKAFFSILFLINISLICGFTTSNIGNSSGDINNVYSPFKNAIGWINISLENESLSKEITLFNSSINIFEAIKKNNLMKAVDYSCIPYDCNMSFKAIGAGSSSKSLAMNTREERLIGLLIDEDNFQYPTNLKIDMTSNALPSCEPSLKVDIGADKTYEWFPDRTSSDLCSDVIGCYSSSSSLIEMSIGREYCQDFKISDSKRVLVGAKVTGDGNGNFTFTVEDETCGASISSSGEVSCSVNLSIIDEKEVSVCMREDSGKYSLNYESQTPICGYSDGADYDFSIFLRKYKFLGGGNYIINSSFENVALSDYIEEYITTEYNGDCSDKCYVPIRFYSLQAQSLEINNLKLNYDIDIGGRETSSIYDLALEEPKLSMSFRKIILDNLDLKVPSYGSYDAIIKFDNVEILREKINVTNSSLEILDITPLEVPAGMTAKIDARVTGNNITKFKWIFGDNNTKETSIASVNHKYSAMGSYNLTLMIYSGNNQVSKSLSIKAVSPKNYINSTIYEERQKLSSIRAEIDKMPLLVKNHISNELNLTNVDIALSSIQSRFNALGNNDSLGYIILAEELDFAKLPISVNNTQLTSGNFLFQDSIINSGVIENITSGDFSGTDLELKDSVLTWFVSSIYLTAELKNYFFDYGDGLVPKFSYVALKIKTKDNSQKDIYASIVGTKSNIETGLYNIIYENNNMVFPLQIGNEKTIEFIDRDMLSFNSLPIYFFTSIDEMIGEINVENKCNYNTICESERGENIVNCRNDCKPWKTAWIMILVSFIILFAIYIILQEWYKKRYEGYLFRDRNELFNIITFMSNNEKRGLPKEDIFKLLENNGWKKEQIVYAYKKLKGLRTGMFEIPIFKIFERKKISNEIVKRNEISLNKNITPRPSNPFQKSI